MESLTVAEILKKYEEIQAYKRRRCEYSKTYYKTEKGKEKLKEAKKRYYLKKKMERKTNNIEPISISIDIVPDITV